MLCITNILDNFSTTVLNAIVKQASAPYIIHKVKNLMYQTQCRNGSYVERMCNRTDIDDAMREQSDRVMMSSTFQSVNNQFL